MLIYLLVVLTGEFMKKLVLVINGESHVEYDRNKILPNDQISYLDKMDAKMDQGIPHNGGHLFAPDAQQKAQFVANQLVFAYKNDEEQMAAATMSYLGDRYPDLQQIVVTEPDGQINIALVYDEPYEKVERVKFVRPEDLNG